MLAAKSKNIFIDFLKNLCYNYFIIKKAIKIKNKNYFAFLKNLCYNYYIIKKEIKIKK